MPNGVAEFAMVTIWGRNDINTGLASPPFRAPNLGDALVNMREQGEESRPPTACVRGESEWPFREGAAGAQC